MKRSVSLLVLRPERGGEVLVVRRPDDDEELPGLWGLPAGTLAEDESWEEAVRRTGRQKLGVDLGPVRIVEEGRQAREGYRLHMRLYRAELEGGEPRVPQPVGGVTQYTAWSWSAPERLEEAAAAGSLCARLCLRWAEREDGPGS